MATAISRHSEAKSGSESVPSGQALNPILKALLLKVQLFRDLREGRALRRMREAAQYPLLLDYPIHAVPRYGHGNPVHDRLSEILRRNRAAYQETLTQFLRFSANLRKIPVRNPDDATTPHWLNGYFQGLDPVSLYAFACLHNPGTYVEVGSGNSTKFMRRAVRDHGLRTRIISIDPHPRAEIDNLCDQVRRESLQDTDLSVFGELTPGDIVLMDGSHRVFMNSDVSVFFLDVLPRLKPGVLVYIDDIYLPSDYPPEWVSRLYSEQYLLAVLLLSEVRRYEILLPAAFIGDDPTLMEILAPLWKTGPIADAARPGNGFWLRIR